jgi:hypothetical protein
VWFFFLKVAIEGGAPPDDRSDTGQVGGHYLQFLTQNKKKGV